MAVLAIKNEPKCKLCRHEKRQDIDTLLELRSNLTRDPVTKELAYTAEKVLAQLAEWGVENPTEENIKNHWKKHCQRVSEEAVESANSVALAVIERINEGGGHADTDENLRLVGTLWREQVEDDLRNGRMPKVPHDVMLKAAAELTRRSASETQHNLLTMFVGATGEALKTIAGNSPKQIEAEVIDAEPADFTEAAA